MSEEYQFLGQNPEKKDKSKLRNIKPFYLKDSSFAFDLWEWKWNPNKKIYEVMSLYYEGMREFIESKNFFKRQLTKQSHIYIIEELNIIDEVTSNIINDEIRYYVDSLQKNVEFEYQGQTFSIPHVTLRNIYLKQQQNIINDKWLTNIQKHDKTILKDNKDSAFFVFKNQFVEVTKHGILNHDFMKLENNSIWKDQIIPHESEYIENIDEKRGEFEKFIVNVCNGEKDRFAALCSAIGYLLHNHFDPKQGQAVILYDEALTTKNKPQGGTGKGLIVNAIKIMRSTAKIDGKNFKSDDKFKWSNITPSTQVVWIDETNKHFHFDSLFSCLTDGWQIERKFQNKFDIPPKDSPKVIICSNTVLENKGSSNTRRQFIVELSDHYSKQIITGTETPIADEHNGIMFSDDWDSNEWNLFFSFMLECVQLYLKNGLMQYERKNVEMNLLKQKTCDEFIEYVTNTPPPLNTDFEITPLFEDFKTVYFGDDSTMVQRTFTNWIKRYCESKNYEFKPNGKSNGKPYYQIREQGNKLQ
jgi:hypothetical protein